jgi:GTP-binding protein EngB required for normal cell division
MRRTVIACYRVSDKPPLNDAAAHKLRNATGMAVRAAPIYRKGAMQRRRKSLPSMQTRIRLAEARREELRDELPPLLAQSQGDADPRLLRLAEITDNIFSRGTRYVCTATNVTFVPDGNPAIPEVAFAGRALTGSSSLIQALAKHARAKPPSGMRDGINYYDVGGVFRIAETPGFGGNMCSYYTALQHAALIRNFVQSRPNLKMLYYLMDCSRASGVAFRDLDMLRYLAGEVKNVTVLLTKSDAYDPSRSIEELSEHGIVHPALAVSSRTLGGIDALRFDMVSNVLHSLPTNLLTPSHAAALGDRLLTANDFAQLKFPEGDSRNARRRIVAPHPDSDVVADFRAAHGYLGRNDVDGPSFIGRGQRPVTDAGGPRDAPPAQFEDDRGTIRDAEVDEVLRDAISEGPLDDGVVAVVVAKPSSPVMEMLPAGVQRHLVGLSTVDGGPLPKALRSAPILQHVADTSPMRNPLLWPPNVIPTASLRRNVVVPPMDQHNPWVTVSHFASPRGDFNFRRPPLHFLVKKRMKSKGGYVRDPSTMRRMFASYTTPYFPAITDIDLKPLPQAFAGGYAAFGREDKRLAAIRLHQQTTMLASSGRQANLPRGLAVINPLLEAPAGDGQPALNGEVARLESALAGVDDNATMRLGYGGSLADRLRSLPPPAAASGVKPSAVEGPSQVFALPGGGSSAGGGQLLRRAIRNPDGLRAVLGKSSSASTNAAAQPVGPSGPVPTGNPFG